MKKLVLFLLSLLFCCASSSGAVFDFSGCGDTVSNEILKDFVKESIEEFNGKTVSYYYDTDNDGILEIVGIVKSNMFYNLDGYKLVILKNKDNNWVLVDNDIYFDLTKNIKIENSKAEYYKTTLNGTKKCTSKISNKTTKSFKDSSIKKDIRNTQKILAINEGTSGVKLELSEISVPVQRAVRIQYRDLTERTKHYLEMK